ncbi:cyclin-dependent kinase inhibitor 7 isoform X2 [Brassica napus]|uniref:cyclin-dependent kinase inhibitor 7 isoform X2 n=1 Tax=Brassica napus TaxID=3708 RepID=UPI0006AB3AEF|nr:cyclin-dependent kinase inhibitor 7 isoform X2 [Brassica napus]
MNEMSERDSKETSFEGSSIKRMRLELDGDDSAVSRSQERTVSSSLAYSASDSEDEDHRSSSVSSGCSSSEIARDTGLPFLDLEQISETEVSSLITINFRAQGSPSSEILGEMDSATTTTKTERRVGQKQEKKAKAPTQAELDDFFSAAERGQQKRFTDKYNYDIVNDTPLEGRYEWVSLKP